ncbi:MAG TPA: hypothetical protein VFT99_02895, partial [Roseiflexaceae bacterium]|nr:hypothetical protein [Roseiflexaceae bacterium]
MLPQTEQWRPTLDRFQRLALIVGVVGAVLSALGAFLGPAQFFYSLLFAFFFWMTLTIGASIVLMIQYLTSGVWGLILRRMLEAAMMTLPLLGVVFLILLLGIGDLYPWSHPEVIQESEVVAKKAGYLNVPFFIVRGIIYFVVLYVVAFLLNRMSSEQDRNGDSRIYDRIRSLSGPGIPIFVLVWTLASTDWGMSLQPEWFSSMYPTTFIVEGLVAAFAWGIVALWFMRSRGVLPYTIPTDRLHDLSKFMFAFMIVWTYVSFSQFLIIWSGNIAEETPWYYYRLNNGWQVLGLLLMIGNFFLPLFAFVSRHPKRRFNQAALMAAWLIFMQAVFVYWAIVPSLFTEGFHISWLDFTALIGVGGLWLAFWAYNLKKRPLLPPNDHRIG